MAIPPSSLFQYQAIRQPDPPHHDRDWASTTAASLAFGAPPFVSPFDAKTTKKRCRDRQPKNVCDLTIYDSDDDEVRPRQAPSSFGSQDLLTTALKSQRLHAPHPSPEDLRKLRVAFFTKSPGE